MVYQITTDKVLVKAVSRIPRQHWKIICILKLDQNCFTTDELASRNSPIWVYTVCPDLSVRKLRNFTVPESLPAAINCVAASFTVLTEVLEDLRLDTEHALKWNQ